MKIWKGLENLPYIYPVTTNTVANRLGEQKNLFLKPLLHKLVFLYIFCFRTWAVTSQWTSKQQWENSDEARDHVMTNMPTKALTFSTTKLVL